jgi:hypothetical protein
MALRRSRGVRDAVATAGSRVTLDASEDGMAGGKIYLREGKRLVAMTEKPYDAEDLLQRLLADYPDLLAGDQMRPSEPRRWLLITREAGVPDTEGGGGRWSLDHLFIDQDAVPTLVEVKRSSDTRIRREVVGQLLEYAANVTAYWPDGQLRQVFEDRLLSAGGNPDGEVLKLLATPVTPEDEADHAVDDFWERAAANLAARRVRLVFVADVIPSELQRIVEFLNENLVRAEVLAVEVKQYVGDKGQQTLVPRVIGRTAVAEDLKQSSGGAARVARSWTEAEFLEATAATGGPDAEHLARACLSWNRQRSGEIFIGRGKYGPLYLQTRDAAGTLVKIASLNTQGYVEVLYNNLVKSEPFDQSDVRAEMNRRLNEIHGVQLPERAALRATWPSIQLSALASEAARSQFFEVSDWVSARLAETPGG